MNLKRFGIIGTPIEHTLSPQMHSFIAEKCGIDMTYEVFDVTPEKLHENIKKFKTDGFSGFNITSPHKIEIMKELDEIRDDAVRMNSVNTIVEKSGKWYGYNTDGDGFCQSLIVEDCEIKGKNILVMGAGGSARSICYKLAEYGANSITITARTQKKIHIIGEMVKKYSDTKFFDVLDKTKEYDIIINTTPLGMYPHTDKNPCDFIDIINEKTVCCDIIYNPQKTVFLQEAEKRGAQIINGLGMLILQGILAFEIFNDVKLNRKEYYENIGKVLSDFKI